MPLSIKLVLAVFFSFFRFYYIQLSLLFF